MISGEGDIVQLDKMYNQMKTERDAATAEVADLKAKVANLEKSLETSNDNISRMEKGRGWMAVLRTSPGFLAT